MAGRRLVDGQSERDDGGDDKNNERDVLQRFPDQLQKGFRRPRWYDVRAKHLLAMPYVVGRTAQTFNEHKVRCAIRREECSPSPFLRSWARRWMNTGVRDAWLVRRQTHSYHIAAGNTHPWPVQIILQYRKHNKIIHNARMVSRRAESGERQRGAGLNMS